MLFKPIVGTTTCLHRFLSLVSFSPFSISSFFKSLTFLFFHICLGHPLGLFVFGIHFVTCPIDPSDQSDLHTCPAQFRLLSFNIPTIFTSPYRSWIKSCCKYSIGILNHSILFEEYNFRGSELCSTPLVTALFV